MHQLSCDSFKLHIQKSAIALDPNPTPSHDKQSFMRDSLPQRSSDRLWVDLIFIYLSQTSIAFKI